MTATLGANDHALASEMGEAIWFLGNLVTIKTAGEQCGEALSVTEHLAPAGFGPPPHIHHMEDEVIYVLAGTIAGFVGEQSFRAGPGGYAFLPRGIPHGWRADDDMPARMLVITTPAGFERFVRESGEPARALTLPTSPIGEAELARMGAAAAKYGIEFLEP
ncbi:MAG TPA: cupin domain-containing protein [Thermomicrobiales bacterium]|jgi:quercetin dioxygenase-like cupin family protein